jgi:nicotinamide-nucleotide amidase
MSNLPIVRARGRRDPLLDGAGRPRLLSVSAMSLSSAARRVARLLKVTGSKVVFAESCTGGLVSAALTKIPGISNFHCGGMVVYRNETKQAYLGVPADLLDNSGPVSRPVVELMARGVLERTPEADLAAAVTGHLGPNAPPKLDGLVFAAIAWRNKMSPVKVKRFRCPDDSRVARQRWVAERVLELLEGELERPS